MNLFKKKEYKFNNEIKNIKVIGAVGCISCEALFNNIKIALGELESNIEPVYIKDIDKAIEYGIMSVPGLIVNNTVVSVGKSLSVQKIKEILSE